VEPETGVAHGCDPADPEVPSCFDSVQLHSAAEPGSAVLRNPESAALETMHGEGFDQSYVLQIGFPDGRQNAFQPRFAALLRDRSP
jgi:hypothetical protein